MIGITIGHLFIIWIIVSCILFYVSYKSTEIGLKGEGIGMYIIFYLMCMLISAIGAWIIILLGKILWMFIKELFGVEWLDFFSTVVI